MSTLELKVLGGDITLGLESLRRHHHPHHLKKKKEGGSQKQCNKPTNNTFPFAFDERHGGLAAIVGLLDLIQKRFIIPFV